MFLEQLKLINFRSFEESIHSSFSQVNCLIGENGAGKTNFLEGIYLLSSNKGFRTGDKKELTLKDADGFFIQGVFNGETIERVISERKKSLTLSEESISANKLRTYNPIVTFAPSDIFLATGSAETRRRFFDAAIALRDDSYSDYLSAYERAIRQRNASLKKDPKHADIWNGAIIQNGAKVIEKRLEFVKLLIPKVEHLYQEFAEETATLKYFNNFKVFQPIEKAIEEALHQSKAEDFRRKHTSKGLHRDDITLLVKGLPAAKSGSQGQNRSLAFALKIGAVEIIEDTLGRKPILLIDDALLELDPKKRKRIFHKLYSSGLQLFLTGTTEEFFHFMEIPEEIKKIYF